MFLFLFNDESVFVNAVQNVTPTLWAGTNNGTVYVFTIAVPGGNKRTEEPVSCQLGEYQHLHNF